MHEISFTKEEYNFFFFFFLFFDVTCTHTADLGGSSGMFRFLPERN